MERPVVARPLPKPLLLLLLLLLPPLLLPTVRGEDIASLLPAQCTENTSAIGEAFFCSCLDDSGVRLEGNLTGQMMRSRETMMRVYNCTKLYGEFMEMNFSFPLYYSYPYRSVGALFQGAVFVVGFLGNVMVVVVVRRSRSMHTPTNCYLVSLAVADIIVLIAAVPNEIFMYFLVAQAWIWGNAGCAILIFLQNMGINASALSVTAFTVERYIAICRPLKARTICTVQRAKRIIFAVWAFAFCYCIPWVFLTTVVPVHYIGISDVQECTFKLSRQAYLGYFFADMVLFYVVPLVLSSVLYTMIAVVVFRPPQILKQMGSSASSGGAEPSSGNSGRAQVIKMLLTVVSLFALLWLPYRSMLVYNSFAQTPADKYMDLWFLMFAKTCVYINSAINPILYNAMSAKFRRAFRQGFRSLCCKRAQRDDGVELAAARRPAASALGERGLASRCSASGMSQLCGVATDVVCFAGHPPALD
ncbi:thyrotropin-releasing hormone receptor-like [Pollicipes pollicipes]|uniref:thyrotropin-releasing hormone receptor-like n=1 Tax=Pollicipes pollicipes TaxID=41117 RepID=UPI0018850810|nr:thyrotropin-releasing hormone receptor-like [Pollicipes pollicipes]